MFQVPSDEPLRAELDADIVPSACLSSAFWVLPGTWRCSVAPGKPAQKKRKTAQKKLNTKCIFYKGAPGPVS